MPRIMCRSAVPKVIPLWDKSDKLLRGTEPWKVRHVVIGAHILILL